MLVLSRKKDEVIVVGDDIEITVVDIRGDQVKIGVSAPRSVSIHRKEVFDAIRNENREAAKSAAGEVGRLAEALRKRRGVDQGQPA
ncbi:MAG: carbon storage regulator CsrA [Candidatus Omnitrophica bacterium]|nr:Translational regulator CsrA [bacterium]NUN95592.1 carbon storage regulator CsrA [Candidatus Omnitrophota bacterium]